MPFFKSKKKQKAAAAAAAAEELSKRLPPDMVYSMEPRHGHAQDVVDENNVRQVAGCLPIDPVNKRFLLVTSSSNPGNWVIPKGGWEQDETQQQAAMRETWEEAGIKGVITRHIGVFAEKSKGVIKAHHWIYEMEIIEVTKKFPEQKKRERRWFTYEEAKLVVKASYILDALSMSSLSPLSLTDCETLQNGEKKKEKKKKKKKQVESDEESSEEDPEEKRIKKEKKKLKKIEKKEKKLKEAQEAELSEADEDGVVLTEEQKKERKRVRIQEAQAALDELLASGSDREESEEEEKKKKKKKDKKKGEISELKEEEMLFSSTTSALGTPAHATSEDRFQPIVQHLQNTHISPQIRPPLSSAPPSQMYGSYLPQLNPQVPYSAQPHYPAGQQQQQRPIYVQHVSQPGPPRQQSMGQSPPQPRQPLFPQHSSPPPQHQQQRPMYPPMAGSSPPPQQHQRQPMFPPHGASSPPLQQQRPMYSQPMYSPQQQQQQQQQQPRPSNYTQQRQGKHHVVEDNF